MPKKRKRNDDDIDLEEDNDIDELNREVEGQPRLGDKRQASQGIVDLRKQKRVKRHKYAKYYQGSYYSNSCSH